MIYEGYAYILWPRIVTFENNQASGLWFPFFPAFFLLKNMNKVDMWLKVNKQPIMTVFVYMVRLQQFLEIVDNDLLFRSGGYRF